MTSFYSRCKKGKVSKLLNKFEIGVLCLRSTRSKGELFKLFKNGKGSTCSFSKYTGYKTVFNSLKFKIVSYYQNSLGRPLA